MPIIFKFLRQTVKQTMMKIGKKKVLHSGDGISAIKFSATYYKFFLMLLLIIDLQYLTFEIPTKTTSYSEIVIGLVYCLKATFCEKYITWILL